MKISKRGLDELINDPITRATISDRFWRKASVLLTTRSKP
jgi:hypothetical protein